jgi:hypothetical protein
MQKQKFSFKTSVMSTVKHEEFKILFPTKILGRTKEHYLILTTSVIPSLPIKHTDVLTHGYEGIRKEVIYFAFQTDSLLSMSTSGHMPIPLAARSQAWVCRCSLAGVVGANPPEDVDDCFF